jgi:hypothetical protein
MLSVRRRKSTESVSSSIHKVGSSRAVTGHFATDFLQLCRRGTADERPFAIRIPPVVPRPRRPQAVRPLTHAPDVDLAAAAKRGSSTRTESHAAPTQHRDDVHIRRLQHRQSTSGSAARDVVSLDDGSVVNVPITSSPTTFLISNDMLTYFRPCIQVRRLLFIFILADYMYRWCIISFERFRRTASTLFPFAFCRNKKISMPLRDD